MPCSEALLEFQRLSIWKDLLKKGTARSKGSMGPCMKKNLKITQKMSNYQEWKVQIEQAPLTTCMEILLPASSGLWKGHWNMKGHWSSATECCHYGLFPNSSIKRIIRILGTAQQGKVQCKRKLMDMDGPPGPCQFLLDGFKHIFCPNLCIQPEK